MVGDEVSLFGTLVAATLLTLLAEHPLPLIPVDVPALSWAEMLAAACAQSDTVSCLLGP